MFSTFDRYTDESYLFAVHSSCIVVDLCFRRVHIGKRKCCRLPRESNDQVHVVKQGVLSLYLDASSHKLRKPKKLTNRWTVLTRCEKTGQHTLHVCKGDTPDSNVKDSFPVQTSWSIKSAHCLKSSQRMEIFKEEGFIIHMGRHVAYISCSSRSEVKSWMCSILEGVTLGFEYHCRVHEHATLGVTGECMLVLTPDCVALLCPLTGATLRKWPYFLLAECCVMEDTLFWRTEAEGYRATVNQHNVFTLYNVLCRYMAHTNPSVQPNISISKPGRSRSRTSSSRGPAENKYTMRYPPAATNTTSTSNTSNTSSGGSTPPGLCNNQLYLSQDAASEKMQYELLSSNHSDYSTGMSSTGSTYDSDIYELMENPPAPHTTLTADCIYEDMSLTDEGYVTSSSRDVVTSSRDVVASSSQKFRLAPAPKRRSQQCQQFPGVYMNMGEKEQGTLVPLTRDGVTSSPRDQLVTSSPRDMSSTVDPCRANCYEYVDIELPGSQGPPVLPYRNKTRTVTPSAGHVTSSAGHVTSSAGHVTSALQEGLKSYQEQVRLQKEMMFNFSSVVLDKDLSKSGSSNHPAFMNSAV